MGVSLGENDPELLPGLREQPANPKISLELQATVGGHERAV